MDVIDLRRLRPPDEIGSVARGLLLPVLAPLSLLYGLGAWVRRKLPVKVVATDVPVVSVGSIAVGGTGKTPICIYVARMLQAAGSRVCIISRGYRRRSRLSPLAVSDGNRMLASLEDAGDEPYMMARRLPGTGVVVSADRVQAALEAERIMEPTVLVLDDGFQYRNIQKDVEVVCLDSTTLKGPSATLPLGILREGWSAIKPEHLIVIMLADGARKPCGEDLERLGSSSIFYATRSEPVYIDSADHPVSDLTARRVMLVSGIARPGAFEATCTSSGLNVVASLRFDDHHWYGPADAERMRKAMKRYSCDNLVTTEKDMPKIPEELRFRTLVARTDVVIEDAERFAAALGGLRGKA
jgi:tetraacyldisaccharide 4'-kinase